jgi:hypothetical protein
MLRMGGSPVIYFRRIRRQHGRARWGRRGPFRFDSGARALIFIYGNQEALQAVTSEKAFLAFLAFMKS